MSRKFFTSDLHFGHNNILKYENRPFKDINEMDNQLIRNWNAVVGKNDEVYILGDVSFHKDPHKTLNILRKLNGRKYLILGNHDKQIIKDSKLREQFEWVQDYSKITIDGIKVVMFHFPIQVWDERHHNAIHLYGHIHSNVGKHIMEYDIPNSYNVGIDVNNYTPVSFEEILRKLGR